MGTRGQVPKRSSQRRRTNSPQAQQVSASGQVRQPAALRHWHPIARSWYASLKKSGQSVFYEPSDWQTARVVAELLTRILAEEKLNAASVSAVTTLMRDLMTTEASRRRVHVEVERERAGVASFERPVSAVDNVIDVAFAEA